MTDFLDILMQATFLYMAYQCMYDYLRLKKEKKLVPSKILYPGGCEPEACSDPAGFIRHMSPWLLAGFCVSVAELLFYVVTTYVATAPRFVSFAVIVLVFAFLVAFMVNCARSAKKFWPQ